MKECNRICEWNNPSNGCVKPETADCKMPNLFKGAKPQTNADRIRAMSDEELAWELMTWRIETCARLNGAESPYPHTQKSILDWLRQPVKDGDNDVG